jgi:exodeoxyribonuclease VII small subunit
MAKRAEQSIRENTEGAAENVRAAPSFEEALAGLERSVEALRGEGTTLDGLIENFKEGMAFYERCAAILEEARQTIEVCGGDGV